MKIFGITGPAQAGKDSLARALLRLSGRGVRLSFAAPIRQFIAGLLGVTVEALEQSLRKDEPLAEFGGHSARQMMQTLGTDWGRNTIHPDIWVNMVRREIEGLVALGHETRPDVLVISDVRYENEAALLRSLGAQLVRIDRPGSGSVHSHSSEAGLQLREEDFRIDNTGSVADLKRIAKDLLDGARLTELRGVSRPNV